MVQTVINKPTLITRGKLRFLIIDAPCDENLLYYIEEMKKNGMTHLVRTCELTYNESAVEEAGIQLEELMFSDGAPPPDSIIEKWLEIVDEVADNKGGVAVHCVAGLGRAPALVAIALIDKGMDPLDAIDFVRRQRKGAINRMQLEYLKNYKSRAKQEKCCCTIM